MHIPDAATALEHATQPRRARAHAETHRRALTSVLASISRAASARLTSTVVDVPTFVFGAPRVCVDDVTEYVRATLEQRGYRVDTFPGIPSVAISWTPQCEPAHSSRRGGKDALCADAPPRAPASPATDYDIGL